ncbi:general stress protein [Terrarubrum flagellatum]|uniref:general stress protein n=1 Tax=Terrirubrum flagellatum TaxID=2895980 RepID=UPI003144F7B8
MTTITRVYDNYSEAQEVVNALEAAGVDSEAISLVSNRNDSATGDGAATGAGVGTALGGGAGLLAGLGVMAIPGLGPVVAAGWLASTAAGAVAGAVAGAAAGGLIGALNETGMSADDASMYAEGVRRGGALVSVKVDDSQETRVLDILDAHEPWDMNERRENWRREGWTKFDPDGRPRTPEEIIRERNMYL